ncbi:MAG: hypothetical protein V2A76_09725 [Planctomycetota bacterium]
MNRLLLLILLVLGACCGADDMEEAGDPVGETPAAAPEDRLHEAPVSPPERQMEAPAPVPAPGPGSNPGPAAPPDGRATLPFVVRNLADRPGDGMPVTLSVAMGEGLFAGRLPVPSLNGNVLPAQVDLRASHRDGSPRHALVSFRLPALKPHEQLELKVNPGSPTPPAAFRPAMDPGALRLHAVFIEKGGRSSEVLVNDGPALVAAAAKGEAPPGYRLIRPGPVLYEVEKVVRPLFQDGRPHPLLELRFRLRLLSDWMGARFEAVVENCPAPAMALERDFLFDDLSFESVSIHAGPNDSLLLFERSDFLHWDRTRYQVYRWLGMVPPELVVRQSLCTLVEGGFLPKYDYEHPLSDDQARQQAISMISRSQAVKPHESLFGVPLVPDPIAPYMPQTGGRRDIGPYPDWAKVAFQSTDSVAQHVLFAADGNGLASFPIHTRQPESGAPGVPFDHPGQKQERFFRAPKTRCPQTPDKMHVPSPAYTSYLLTGEEFFAEEMSFWAAYGVAGYPWDGILTGPGRRDGAWQLRNLTDAAFLLPDAHPLKSYFNERVHATLARWKGMSVDTDKKLHVIEDGAWRISGRNDYICALRISPWMYTWFIWSLDNTARKGFGEAAPIRDWCAEFIIGLYTDRTPFRAPDGQTYVMDPEAAMSYSMPVALVKPAVEPGVWKTYEYLRPIESYGELYYYFLVNESNQFQGSEGFKGIVPGDTSPENWRIDHQRLAGFKPRHASWEFYANGDCAPTLVRLGLPGAEAVFSHVKRKMAMSPPKGGWLPGLLMVP